MDDTVHEALIELGLPEVEPISLGDFEEGDKSLLEAKQNRSRIEYCFTCTPSLPLYVLKHWSEVDLITYLDADLYFFANPAPLFEEMGDGSIAIIAHRHSPHLRKEERYGVYNVGWLSFRRDDNGFACLNWWREKCIEWCYDQVENDRFADQKYLNEWTSRFHNVVVLAHQGANVAPWNVSNYHLSLGVGGKVMVDGRPLLFFHFHCLKKITPWLYDPGWGAYGVIPSRVLRGRIYTPYILCLDKIRARLESGLGMRPDSCGLKGMREQDGSQVSRIRYGIRTVRAWLRFGKHLLRGRCIILLKFGRSFDKQCFPFTVKGELELKNEFS